MEAYSYRPWDRATMTEIRAFVAARAWTSAEGPTRLFERAVVWLRDNKILLPGVTVLVRLVSEIRSDQGERFHTTLTATVTATRLQPTLDSLRTMRTPAAASSRSDEA